MSVARDPNGNECCLRVDASGSLLTAAGAMTAQQRQEQADACLIYGEMRMFAVPPDPPWVEANGQKVTVRGKTHTIPKVGHMYVYLPDESVSGHA